MKRKVAKPPFLRMLPPEVLWLLVALSFLLFCFQFITLNKLGVLPPSALFFTLSRYVEEVTASQISFDWLDMLLTGMIASIFIVLIVLEITRNRISLFLAHFLTSDLRAAILLSISSLVITRFYFAPGMLSWAGDAPQHIVYSDITSRIMADGQWPIWTNWYGTGSPYLQFYGFFFFLLAGLTDMICRDVSVSLKLLLAATHLVSGIGMYFLARTLCRSRRAGFLAGIGYVICFWHTQHVLFMGRLPLSLFYALLPWPFYYFERLRISPHRSTLAAGGGLTLGLLILTHPGYGFWATALLALYMGVQVLGIAGKKDLWSILSYSIAILLAGLAFSACLTLPMWVERDFTGLRAGFAAVSFSGVPDPTWQHLLIWSNFRFWLLALPQSAQHWYGGYLGLSLVAIALFGLIGNARSGRGWPPPQAAGGLCLLFSLLLVFGYRWPFISSLPGIHILASYRYLVFVTFFLTLMVGFGTRALLILIGRKRRAIPLFSSLLLLVALDLGPTTFQQPYSSEYTEDNPSNYPLSFFTGFSTEAMDGFSTEAMEYYNRGELPPYRIFWALRDINPYLALGRLAFAIHTPTPQAPHPGELRANDEFVRPLERYISVVLAKLPKTKSEVSSIKTIDVITDALGLLNVKHLLATQANKDIGVLTFVDHTPILVSPRISGISSIKSEPIGQQLEMKEFQSVLGEHEVDTSYKLLSLFWVVRNTGVNLHNKTCDRVILSKYQGDENLGTSPAVELLSHQVWNQRVEIRARVSAPCFARLAYAYFPYLHVYVDGNEVESMETADHFVALRLEAGEHLIVLEPHLSPLRRILLWLDLIMLGAAIWVWVRERRRQIPAR